MFDDLPPAGGALPPLPDWLVDTALPDLPDFPGEFLPAPPVETATAVAAPPDPMPAVTPPPRAFRSPPSPAPPAPPAPDEPDEPGVRVPAHVRPAANGKVAILGMVGPPAGECWADVRVALRVPPELRAAEVHPRPAVARGRVEWELGELDGGAGVRLLFRVPAGPVADAYLRTPPQFVVTYRPADRPELAVILTGPARVPAGVEFDAEVTVENVGRGTARAVALAVTRGDQPAEQTVYPVGDLPAGEWATATLHWTAPAADGPAHWHVRTVGGPHAATHTFTADVYTPVPVAVVAPESLPLDEVGTFGVTVTNSSAARRSVTAVLHVPPQLQFESSDGRLLPAPDRVAWVLADLAAGESRTVSARLRGFLPGPLTVTAEAATEDGSVSATAACVCELPADRRSANLAAALAGFDYEAVDPNLTRAAPAVVGERHLLFRMGDGTYACPLAQLREVIRPPVVTPVPDAPEWLTGLANVRGDVTSIVDLPAALGLRSSGGPRSVLVAETTDRQTAVGLLVDGVVGIRRMAVVPWSAAGAGEWGQAGEFVTGLGGQGDNLAPVLDLDRVLHSHALTAFGAA